MKTGRINTFSQTRKHHSTEAAEDYTELIAELIQTQGKAKVVEIARRLGITHVTAIRTIKRLEREGYVTTSSHKPVLLTPLGEKTAKIAKERHQVLVDFFISIGVPRKVAEIDAEGAEHHISPTTLSCIRKKLGNLTKKP